MDQLCHLVAIAVVLLAHGSDATECTAVENQQRWKDTVGVTTSMTISPAPTNEHDLATICCQKCKEHFEDTRHCRLWMSLFTVSQCYLYMQHGTSYINPYNDYNVTFGVNTDAYPKSALPRAGLFYNGEVQVTIANLSTPHLCMSICSDWKEKQILARDDICRSYTWATMSHPSSPGECHLRGYANNTKVDPLYYGGHFGRSTAVLGYAQLNDTAEIYTGRWQCCEFRIAEVTFSMSTNGEKLAACLELCVSHIMCRWFSIYLPSGQCRIYWAVHRTEYSTDANYMCGTMKSGFPESTDFVEDVVFFGKPYLRIVKPGALACQATCVQEDQCRYYDYDSNTKMCNLKTNIDFAVHQPGWIAGSIAGDQYDHVFPVTANPFVITPRLRLNGRVIVGIEHSPYYPSINAGSTKCALLCYDDEKCRAYQHFQEAEDCWHFYGFNYNGYDLHYPDDVLEPYSGINKHVYPESALPVDEVEVQGQVIRTYPNLSDALFCLAFCEGYYHCRAYSYHTKDHNTNPLECRLHLFPNTSEAIHPMANVQSGILGLSAAALGIVESESYYGAAGKYFGGTHMPDIVVSVGSVQERIAECCRLCSTNMSCRAWASRSTDGFCYRYTKITSIASDGNWYAGVMKQSYPRSTYPRANAELDGVDHSVISNTPNAFFCQAFCLSVDGCVAYVWYETTEKCHLKKTFGTVGLKNGSFAASITNRSAAVGRFFNNWDTFEVFPNMDFNPITIGSMISKATVGMLKCSQLCSTNLRCFAFVFAKTDKGCKLYDDLAPTTGVLVPSYDTTVESLVHAKK